MCARRSWCNLEGSNPSRVKLNQQPVTNYRIGGGNKTNEAGMQEIPGRNVSECCKPRNCRVEEADSVFRLEGSMD